MNTDGHGCPEKPFPVAVIEAVLAAGVQEFVICAGARNSALIVVLAALGDKVRLWQHFDERAAGFFAIGRIRATERPVAVVTTSGTAAAELLPAVIEAHYQGLPLVALTADRPKHYRGSGAPQAIEQAFLFQCYATGLDVYSTAQLEDPGLFVESEWGSIGRPLHPLAQDWSGVGPLHLNCCLEESHDLAVLRSIAQAMQVDWMAPVAQFDNLFPLPVATEKVEASCGIIAERLMVVGELLASQLPGFLALVQESSAAVYAEAASGLRDAPELQARLLRCGDSTLRHLPAREVVRFGGVPSLRWWRDLEDRPDISVQSSSRSGHCGLARVKSLLKLGELEFTGFLPMPEATSAARILSHDAALYARLGELLTRFPNSEPALFRRLSQVIPQGATVFTGNSLAIREWNLCAEYGRGHRVHVLRGANGIDGNLSAFLGVAADAAEAWCVTGDLTALYDLNAPWMLKQLSPGRRRFVVIQNAGGKIFSRLPALRGLTERERTLMENPHAVSLRGWAEMWGMDHASGDAEVLARAETLAEHAVIELYPDAAETEAFWNAWAAAETEIWS